VIGFILLKGSEVLIPFAWLLKIFYYHNSTNIMYLYGMPKLKVINPVEYDEDGTLILNLDASEASVNWLYYGRLLKRAEEGDEEARKEAERMDNSQMVIYEDD